MVRFEVLTRPERRRRWSEEEKRAVVLAAFAPGAVVSKVARQNDIYPCQIYRWRRRFGLERSGFLPVMVTRAKPEVTNSEPAAIEITVDGRTRVRIPASTSPALAAAVIRALERR